MTVDSDEHLKFSAILRKTSLQKIQKALDDNVITRPWKRKLAEDEPARRDNETEEQEKRGTRDAVSRKRALSRRAWAVVTLLIAATLFYVVVSVYGLWHV